MKKLGKRFAAVVLAVLMVLTCAPTALFAEDAADNAVLNTLQNTLYKLTADKNLKVGYIGGSITVGAGIGSDGNINTDCYRALTTSWIRNNFPDATVTETNAGIGGTGSKYGLFRADRDLKLDSDNCPDLTFVEFAINDIYDRLSDDEESLYYESLIKKLYAANPNMDIVCLFSTDIHRNQPNAEFKTKDIQKKIAEHYGIPTVDMGAQLKDFMIEENGGENISSIDNAVWKKYYSDVVHPSKNGHGKYAEYVTAYLSNVLTADGVTAPSGLEEKVLPTSLRDDLAEYAYIATAAGTGYSPYGNQWTLDTGSGTISATQGSQTFEFSFTGTRLELQTNASSDYGNIKYIIDGTEYSTSLVHGGDCKIVELASGLENKEHTVTLVTADDTIPGGKTLSVYGICIAGDSEKRGITVNTDETLFKVYNLADNSAVRIQNLNFIDGSKVSPYDGNKYIKSSGGDLSNYAAPFFFRYDLSELKDADIVAAAYVGMVSKGRDNIKFYDVPSDNLALTYTGSIPNRIEINTTPFKEQVISNARDGYEDSVVSPDITGLEIGYDANFSVDITDWVKEQAKTENGLATMMVYSTWGGQTFFGDKKYPVLWVKTAIENDTPSAKIEVSESTITEGDVLTVTGSATDNQGVTSASFYVDGTLYTGDVAACDGSYTANIEGLTAGNHTITFKAVDRYGAEGTAEANVRVMMNIPYSSAAIVKFSEATNPNFTTQQDKHFDQHNLVVTSGTSVPANQLTADKVEQAPVFLKFDISSAIDPDGDGTADYGIENAYLLAQASSNGMPINTYIVPSNDISLETLKATGEYKVPEISMVFAGSSNNQGIANYTEINADNAVSSLLESGSPLNAAHNIKNVVESAVKDGDTSFSLMIYSNWGGSTQSIGAFEAKKQPRLYLTLVKMPTVELADNFYSYDAAGNMIVTAKAKYETDIEKAELYIDGALAASGTAGGNGVYTFSAGAVSEGEHTFTVTATGANTVSGSASKTVNVKKLFEVVGYNGRRTVINQSNKTVDEFTDTPAANDGNIFNYDRDGGYRNVYYNFDVAAIAEKAQNPGNISKIYIVAKGDAWNSQTVGFAHMNYTDLKAADYDALSGLSQKKGLGDAQIFANDADMSGFAGINSAYNTKYNKYFVLDATDYIKDYMTDGDDFRTEIQDMIIKSSSPSYLSSNPTYMLVEYSSVPDAVYDEEDTLTVKNAAIDGDKTAAGTNLTASYEVMNKTGKDIETVVFAGYYKDGALVASGFANAVAVPTSGNKTTVLSAQIGVPELDSYENVTVRAYLWKDGTLKPLTEQVLEN